jgi:ubiquinone/menaquinone biosynthesis C-methylase UbiE
MAEFHFVEDYQNWIRTLIATYPLDEAMSLAVGGYYEAYGAIERAILHYAGLQNGMSLIDLGCGSGRLANALSKSNSISYLGIDIVEELLVYAKSKSDQSYRFILNRALNLPVEDNHADMVSAFSVFTHLLHDETYIYMEDIQRILRPGGCLVFSFLEFDEPMHWPIFTTTVNSKRNNFAPPLNQFIERNTIDTWCKHLGFKREAFISGGDTPWNTEPALGQAVAILRKP